MGCCPVRLYQMLCFPFAFLLFQVNSSSISLLSSPPPPQLCLPQHSSALIRFKNSLSSFKEINIPSFPIGSEICRDSDPKTEFWNQNTDCCSWEGVTCHSMTGRVIGLDLSCSPLRGSLPSNSSLFLLQDLQWLNLAHLQFSGFQIPSEFNKLRSLSHLNLSYTGVHGMVTGQISPLSELVSLDLSSPQLMLDNHHFNMLVLNLTKLENLFLDHVDMSLVRPNSFRNLTSSLKRLSLYGCQLQGKFPSEIFSFPYLENIILTRNDNLSGYLPKSNWSTPLRFLHLSRTSFSDELPDSIGNLENLEELDLSFCHFTGSIPSSLGNLTKITFLDLKSNNFEGQIPDVFGNFKKLNKLDFSSNNFHGLLPSSVFNLTAVTDMALNNNHLGGPLPYNISGLSNLQSLFLSANLLNGRVPGWLFSLPVNLAFLDLSSNNLSGSIESCMLSKLRNLWRLDLSNNSLLSLSSCSNDVNSTFPKLNILCFSPCNIHQFPSFLRASETLSHLDLSNNKIQGSISKWEAEGWESLIYLDLSFNLLTNVEQFPGKNLQTIDLRSNSLQGPLPTPPQSINHLLISENELTGEIPSGFCNITSPLVLDLSKNNLSGIIPRCLGNYHSLSVLDLRMNNFDGKIPRMCTDEGSLLRSLNLNNNQLEGPMPRSLVDCSELEVLDLGNNLNDSFPHWLGVLSRLQILVLRSNKFHGPVQNLRGTSFITSLRIIDLSRNEFNGHLPTKFFQNLKAMKDMHEEPTGPTYIEELPYFDSIILTIQG
ncbi:PREDICTED: receptor-like protein 12 [Theobroma cacao]|uniref:Receptor-like protein 12 n=1 Tax=Theobroma cacao TaxID=3641 RepID=A0AB32WL59_THECC|nr:PREDICTED: receptor-like protein 12 [Theobroma cacao]